MKILGYSKKALLSCMCEKSYLNHMLRKLRTWRGVLVLNYHRIGNPQTCEFDRNVYSASQDNFDEQIKYLKQNFDIINTHDLAELSHAERKNGRNVLITFDDGYRDNYELAFPVLEAANTTATFFITTGFIENRIPAWWDEIAWIVRHSNVSQFQLKLKDHLVSITLDPQNLEAAIKKVIKIYWSLSSTEQKQFLDQLCQETKQERCPRKVADETWMTWEMICEMEAGGMDFGGHTVNHPIFTKHPVETWDYELKAAKQQLETKLENNIVAFSYPVGGKGMFDDVLKEKLRSPWIQTGIQFLWWICTRRCLGSIRCASHECALHTIT